MSGYYDGLFLLERRDVGDAREPRETTVRGAMASSRGLKPNDWERVGEIIDEKAPQEKPPEKEKEKPASSS